MNKHRGFTIIEVLIVVVIIGLLVAAATINYEKARSKGRDTVRKSDISSLAIALDSYYNANRYYPGNPGTSPNSLQGNNWIPNLDEFLNPLPKEKGPQAGDTDIHDNPCQGAIVANRSKRNYNYFTDGIFGSGTLVSGYALLARLEIDNDTDTASSRTSCTSGQNETITFGSDGAGGQQTLIIEGYPIFAIYK